MTPPVLFLASASERRMALLRQIAVAFQILHHTVDEVRLAQEAPRDFVLRMAREKALSARNSLRPIKFDQSASMPDGTIVAGKSAGSEFDVPLSAQAPIVLGADTIVVCDSQVLGKPLDYEDAVRMLSLLSGRAHRVLSAVAVVSGRGTQTAISETVVEFRAIERQQIERYWHSGEPEGKAGAYAIQGLGGVFVKRITGSYTGVVGLPLYETALLLQEVGVACWQPDARTREQE